MLGAGIALAEEAVAPLRAVVREVDQQRPVGHAQGGLDRVGHAGGIGPGGAVVIGPADGQPVDHHLDRVLELLVERDLLVQVPQLAVDPHPHESRLLGARQQLLVLALAIANQGRQQHQARPLRQVVELVDDLLHRLPRDLATADRAVHPADPREEEAQVVVDLGDGANRRARVLARPLLIDADRRGQAVDLVDVGLLHLPQELPRVGAQRLHVAALPLRVDRVEGEAALAGARQSGDHDQPVARHLHVQVLEVVLACAAHDDPIGGHQADDIRPMRTPVRFAAIEGGRRRWSPRTWCDSDSTDPGRSPAWPDPGNDR